ncbi:tyrosine--tRNA ligase [Tumebacillus flagellatus]|uniref:Tyrosine--tRNA ligase n=1 Tax=Tumebacillus flagellatus TaxID=1157490 RepID=A0A074M5N0_9BACL|nr:tyrosine--tRNA ligase [Tumebacillus flagellatus]KEO81312.1 tyrosyl-tRNA synthetase [Tumebacillus flagellatus]
MAEEVKVDPAVEAEVARQMAVLTRGAAEVIPVEDLEKKVRKSIKTGKQLTVKLGIDPTGSDLTLGHTVVLQKLRQFQDLGHKVQLLIGDFTGMIGDPTDRTEARKQLTREEVLANAATFKEQAFKVLDSNPEKVEVMYNSAWLSKLNFADVLELASKMTVARMLERDDFKKRYEGNMPISLHEFMYPLMQGYDSVAMRCDVEIGGTDQTFNVLMGRMLQEKDGQEPQVVITMPLLVGLDGVKKMGKSAGNYIGVMEGPNEQYGKTMSIPDHLIVTYFELVTDVSLEDVQAIKTGLADKTLHPRDAKMALARAIVTKYHGDAAAQEAENYFKTVFQNREIPEDLPEYEVEAGTKWVVALLTELKLAPSNGEARRLIQQGGLKINSEKVEDPQLQLEVQDGMILQAGKRKFAKLIVK